MHNRSSEKNENKKTRKHIPRRYKRFKAQEGAFALLWPYFNKRGQIIDIGLGGLAFQYVALDDDTSNASSEIDILMVEDGFYLDKIPFEAVYDIELPKESPHVKMQMRRFGVKFNELNPEQSSKLEFFINNYTVGEV